MKKEDVLKKAQEEGSDEMEKSVQSAAMWCGAIIMAVFLISFSIIRRLNDQNTSDLTATICAGVAAENYFIFKRIHNKRNLVFAIIMTIGAVLSVIFFVLERLNGR